MVYHWIPPPSGSLKINVHATYSNIPAENSNVSGFEVIYRNSNGQMKHTTLGVIHNLSPLGNELWAIYLPLRRAFLEGYRDVILETDNMEAFRVIRDYSAGALAAIYDIASQIDMLVGDSRWYCLISYIFPARK